MLRHLEKRLTHHRRKSVKSQQPKELNDEDVLGDFGKQEKEAISDSESEDALPSYTFAAPISRLSRSPTPMRRTVVSAPGRRFVPSKKAEAISDSSDDEAIFTGRTSMIGGRSFNAAGRMSTTGRMSMAGPATATQT